MIEPSSRNIHSYMIDTVLIHIMLKNMCFKLRKRVTHILRVRSAIRSKNNTHGLILISLIVVNYLFHKHPI